DQRREERVLDQLIRDEVGVHDRVERAEVRPHPDDHGPALDRRAGRRAGRALVPPAPRGRQRDGHEEEQPRPPYVPHAHPPPPTDGTPHLRRIHSLDRNRSASAAIRLASSARSAPGTRRTPSTSSNPAASAATTASHAGGAPRRASRLVTPEAAAGYDDDAAPSPAAAPTVRTGSAAVPPSAAPPPSSAAARPWSSSSRTD